jgi:hypothetical protein
MQVWITKGNDTAILHDDVNAYIDVLKKNGHCVVDIKMSTNIVEGLSTFDHIITIMVVYK